MQFNRDATGKMTPLPKPSIDTGAGLERLASALQNVPTNFDSDLLKPIMEKVFDLSGKSMEKSREVEVASKVIADHSRAAAFLIGDGILPSNEGRGYVLRRIMRRAIRYGRNIGLKKPFLHETARVVFEIMKTSYPDLKEASAFITSVIKNEEMRFADTLDHGLRLLTDTLQELHEKGRTVIPGEFIFKLYDTYGFPVDIVRDVVREENFSLDMDGFESCMDDQREKSKAVAAFSELGEAYKKLSSRGYKPKFIGYEHLSCEAEVVLLVKDGREVEAATEGSFIEIVTDKTPFYGESGGQVGDKGSMYADGLKVVVHDTIKDPTGLIIHQGEIAQGSIRKGQKLTLTVSGENRGSTALNHTATHILHSVLRKVLGDHVKQAGSLVAPDRLRFDFTHFAQVEPEVLDSIERMVNEQIQRNVAVDTEEMIAERAFKSGATALFEEKYGDRVRVVSLADFSKELCGGTHTSRTGNIGLFRIISESSVASGIRRIEAMTGPEAVAFTQQQNRVLRETARMLKEKPDTLLHRVEKMLKHQKMLEKELDQMKSKLAVRSVEDKDEGIRSINGVKVIARRVEVDDPSALRELADRFKEKIQSGIVVLGAESGSKALLVTAVTRDLTKRFHAGKIVSALAKELGGGGGGRPDMAQAGGNEPEKLDAVLEKVFQLIEG
jgi:alanyl-tRNA synthetase